MALRDLWQRVLTEMLASEFGPEIAAELAVLPVRQRRERERAWHHARPSQSFLLLIPSRWESVHFKLRVLHTIAAEQGARLTPGAATAIAREIASLEEILAAREAALNTPAMALFLAEEHLRRAERVLAYASAAVHDLSRPLSVEGREGLQILQTKSIALITRKNRVQLLLEDFERSHERVAEQDRSNLDHRLTRIKNLHRAYEDIVPRMQEVLRAEEEVVRQGFTADADAFDRFNAELAFFDRQYEELKRRK